MTAKARRLVVLTDEAADAALALYEALRRADQDTRKAEAQAS